MKTLNEYMELPYKMEIIEDKEEGGFVVSFPDLPGCISCGETVEGAVSNAMDAKKLGWRRHWKRELLFMNQTALRIIQDNSNCGFPKACIVFWQSILKRKASV